MTHADDEHQIMTWLTRNPAFETVSTKTRKALTYSHKGELRDSDTAGAAIALGEMRSALAPSDPSLLFCLKCLNDSSRGTSGFF